MDAEYRLISWTREERNDTGRARLQPCRNQVAFDGRAQRRNYLEHPRAGGSCAGWTSFFSFALGGTAKAVP